MNINFMGRNVRQDFKSQTLKHTATEADMVELRTSTFYKKVDEEGVKVFQRSKVHNQFGVYIHTEVECVYQWDDGEEVVFPRDDFKSLVRVG